MDVLMSIAIYVPVHTLTHHERVIDLYPLTMNETNRQTKTTYEKYIYRLWGRCGVLKKSRTMFMRPRNTLRTFTSGIFRIKA